MSLLDPKWKYTHSTATDIRKTFAKARRELAKKRHANTLPPKLQLVSNDMSCDRNAERVEVTAFRQV